MGGNYWFLATGLFFITLTGPWKMQSNGAIQVVIFWHRVWRVKFILFQLTAESLLSEDIPFRLANISQKQSRSFRRMDTRKVMTEVRLFMFDVGGDLTIWRRINYQISIRHSLIQLNPSWLMKENLVKAFEIVPGS